MIVNARSPHGATDGTFSPSALAQYAGVTADAIVTALAFLFALELDVTSAPAHLGGVVALSVIAAIVSLPVRRWALHQFRLDGDGLRLFGILGSALFASMLVRAVVPGLFFIPSSALLLGAALAALGCACSRYAFTNYRTILRRRTGEAATTIVVGSRDAATSFIQATKRKRDLGLHVIGCVDEVSSRRSVAGAPVLGRVANLPALIRKYRVDTVVIAVPDASEEFIGRVEAACALGDDPSMPAPIVRVMPGASTLLREHARRNRRELRSEDVLHRDTNQADIDRVRPYIENQVVLVTGAGGSIGSEISRQTAALNPKQLILLGHGENSLFTLEQELRNERNFDMTKIVLADITDADAIRTVFSTYRPNIVFHAAAHKHVPILEYAPCEAVRNNVMGTHNVALAAAASGVAKFILLSTDKAVNPTSVMGATKRLAELVCQSFAHRTVTEFVSVRFGNVLGSRGSVLPTFRRQVERGGPVTITHRDMERFFMTIPEAVSLVLQAMSIGRDGQVFVLDMGKPVKILDLAEKVIRLSGYIPYREVDIVEVGIRPGEKLYEEILTTGEGMSSTEHNRLFIAQQERLDYNDLANYLRQLSAAAHISDWRTVIRTLVTLVPTYTPGEHFREALPAPAVAEALPVAASIPVGVPPLPEKVTAEALADSMVRTAPSLSGEFAAAAAMSRAAS